MNKITAKELKNLVNLIEEFTWISDKISKIDTEKLKSISDVSEQEVDNKGYLIGNLPNLLLDRDLFGVNKDIYDFAVLLGIKMNPKSNRSRNEMIGTIVCELQEGNSVDINRVYKIIDSLLGNDLLLNKIKNEKKISGGEYDWNVVIKQLHNKG